MSRRRYISTDTSVDRRFNQLASTGGEFACLLYLLMIPHAEDDASITSDPYELKMAVVPGLPQTPEDIHRAVEAMITLDLVFHRDGRLVFPESFYKHQTYIKAERRRTYPNTNAQVRPPAKNAAKRRSSAKTPHNAEEHRTSGNFGENAALHSHSHSKATAVRSKSQDSSEPPEPETAAAALDGKANGHSPITALTALGVKLDTARQLALEHPPNEIHQQIAWLPHRDNIRHKPAAIIAAIREHWEPPATDPRRDYPTVNDLERQQAEAEQRAQALGLLPRPGDDAA